MIRNYEGLEKQMKFASSPQHLTFMSRIRANFFVVDLMQRLHVQGHFNVTSSQTRIDSMFEDILILLRFSKQIRFVVKCDSLEKH